MMPQVDLHRGCSSRIHERHLALRELTVQLRLLETGLMQSFLTKSKEGDR